MMKFKIRNKISTMGITYDPEIQIKFRGVNIIPSSYEKDYTRYLMEINPLGLGRLEVLFNCRNNTYWYRYHSDWYRNICIYEGQALKYENIGDFKSIEDLLKFVAIEYAKSKF